MSDDASLSEHEQRVLEEIERNLLADDPGLVKRVRQATPRRDSIRLLRWSVFSLVVGLVLLLGFAVRLELGILGFLVMLAGAVGVGYSMRQLSAAGNASSSLLRDVLKRAESRLRDRRSKP